MHDDFAELLDHLPDREGEALEQPRLRTPELCDRLLRRIDQVRRVDPETALGPARFALRLAARLPNPFVGHAWATWAAVHRTLGNPDHADLGRRFARLYLDDPVDLARVYRRQARLLRDHGQFDPARARIEHALAASLACGDSHSRGCALADLAAIYLAENNPDEAVLRCTEALRYVDPNQDPDDHRCAVHRLAVALRRCDRPAARFEGLLKEIRQRRFSQGSLPWARHRWLEGLIFQRRGRYQRAEVTLRAARNQFLKLDAIYDAAVATMDLAELYVILDDPKKNARRAREILPVFESLGIDPEAAAALRLYVQAAAAHELTRSRIEDFRETFRELFRATAARP